MNYDMDIISIKFSDFNLVEIKITNECKPTPHCKKCMGLKAVPSFGTFIPCDECNKPLNGKE